MSPPDVSRITLQCGPITDVGISLDKMDGNITKSGSLPQHMTSCLDVLDYFLNQNRPVVSSLIPIERSVEIKTDHGEYTNTVEAFVLAACLRYVEVELCVFITYACSPTYATYIHYITYPYTATYIHTATNIHTYCKWTFMRTYIYSSTILISYVVAVSPVQLDVKSPIINIGLMQPDLCRCPRLGDLGPDVRLVDLGLDSHMGVEVSQKLQRDYDVALTMKDIRQLTFPGLRDIGQSLRVDGEGERKITLLRSPEWSHPCRPILIGKPHDWGF